ARGLGTTYRLRVDQAKTWRRSRRRGVRRLDGGTRPHGGRGDRRYRRLHTKSNLMSELEKMKRTAAKLIPGAPHDVLLVLDATTGQNGLAQAREFTAAAGVTGIVLTKLDGTARGGIVVPIMRELGLPVRFVGTGETAEDLVPFDAQTYV